MSTAENIDIEVEQNIIRPEELIEGETIESTQNCIVGHKRKLISPVWNDFTKLKNKNGDDIARCNWYKKELCGGSSKESSHLRKHLNTCIFRKKNDGRTVQQSITKGFYDKAAKPYKFDQEKSRKDLARMIIKYNYSFNMVQHEYFEQFCAGLNPNFKLVSHNTIRSDILNVYKEEKAKLYEYFDALSSKIAFTTDIWTSDHSNVAYACLTAHYISDVWELKKKIIAFKKIPYPYDGETLFHFISDLLLEWNLDKKFFSMVFDNASANDVMVRQLKRWLCEKSLLSLSGVLFHVRCSAHILNLIVQDGLAKAGEFLQKIRDTVSLLNRSPALYQKFEKALAQLKLTYAKKVGKDVPNRWNSTYLMLDASIPLKEAYYRLSQLERGYKYNPSEDEWKVACIVRDCLKLFYDATNHFSGSKFPTSNMFFRDICKIQLKMREWENSEHECLRLIAGPMKEKFAKYWEECSLPLAVATVLDPRFKIDIVEYYYDQLYGSSSFDYIDRVRTVMFDLYNEYRGEELLAGNSAYFVSSGSSNANSSENRDGVSLDDEHDFDEWYRRSRSSIIRDSNKSELEKYLEEVVFPRKDNFDILNWWKMNSARYPILAKIARDILAIPATTVTSESAFSIGGRVIDERRSCLAPEIVEALLTTSDWLESTKNDVGTSIEL